MKAHESDKETLFIKLRSRNYVQKQHPKIHNKKWQINLTA